MGLALAMGGHSGLLGLSGLGSAGLHRGLQAGLQPLTPQCSPGHNSSGLHLAPQRQGLVPKDIVYWHFLKRHFFWEEVSF